MTLLLTLVAAILVTIRWYQQTGKDELQLTTLCFMFWGASLMWMVDAVVEYQELGAEFFTPSLESMINDSFLGLSVVVLGFVIWLIKLLISDPSGKLRRTLTMKYKEEA